MARYMIQATTTSQAAAAVLQNPEDRTEAVRPVFEAFGASLEHYYVSLAENMIFVIADIPDEATLGAITMGFFARAPWESFRAMPILTASESVEVFKRAASMAYRPPGK